MSVSAFRVRVRFLLFRTGAYVAINNHSYAVLLFSADMELKNFLVGGFVAVVGLVAVIVCACLLIALPGLFTGAGLPNHRTCGECL